MSTEVFSAEAIGFIKKPGFRGRWLAKAAGLIKQPGFRGKWLKISLAGFITLRLTLLVFSRLALNRILGLRGLFDKRTNYGDNDVDHREMPRKNSRALKRILFARGLLSTNYVFQRPAKRHLEQAYDYIREHFEPLEPKPIERMDIQQIRKDREGFARSYLAKPRPLILTNVGIDLSMWSFEHLFSKLGHVTVSMSDLETGATAKVPLTRLKDTSRRLYVHNNESLWAHDPALIESLGMDEIGSILNRRFDSAQLFLGTHRASGTAMHCANNFNIFFQLKGRKRWDFVNPEYTFFVYPIVSANYHYFGSLIRCASEYEMTKQTTPLYAYCPRYASEMEEGEVLINPPLWWHAVEALSEETISVATRWGPAVLGTLCGNQDLKKDIPESNHVLTSIQLLSAKPLKEGYPAAVNHLEVAAGLRPKGMSYSGTADNTTAFEERTHDHLPADLASGKALQAWLQT